MESTCDANSMPTVAPASLDILLITHNGLGHLQRLLPTLKRTTYPNFRLLLLDNGSSDGSREWVEQNWPGVIVVRSEINLGFAGINNRGLERSIADGIKYALLLNDDTEILDPDWATHAIEFMEATANAAVIGFQETSDPTSALNDVTVRETEWVSGFAVLFRVEALMKVGLFDEKYFAYWEERDLEARIAAGGNGIYQISIPVYHRGGGTFGRATSQYVYLMMRNAIRYSLKNEGLKQAVKRPLQYFLIAVSPIPIFKTPHALHMRQA
ncbi:MAG TPA: glycosyltransferase family 2 protein, partial [Fimbriimonadaceae bacterium]|nr:glycosyltransferase family 2 protein [Fimbriimonadaceae bacterium]